MVPESPGRNKAHCRSLTHIARLCRSLQPGQSSFSPSTASGRSAHLSRAGNWIKVAASDSPDPCEAAWCYLTQKLCCASPCSPGRAAHRAVASGRSGHLRREPKWVVMMQFDSPEANEAVYCFRTRAGLPDCDAGLIWLVLLWHACGSCPSAAPASSMLQRSTLSGGGHDCGCMLPAAAAKPSAQAARPAAALSGVPAPPPDWMLWSMAACTRSSSRAWLTCMPVCYHVTMLLRARPVRQACTHGSA